MASNSLPWYKKLFGDEIITCRAFKNVNTDGSEAARVCVDTVFQIPKDNITDCDRFIVGIYFTSLDVNADDKTNQLLQLYHAINGIGETSSNTFVSNSNREGSTKFIVVLVGIGQNTWHKSSRKLGDDRPMLSKVREMPWYLVHPSEKAVLQRLTRKFEIKTLSPTLALLDGNTGEVITKHGFDKLETDPNGVEFPWRPLPLPRLLENVHFIPGGKCEQRDVVPYNKLTGIIIGFYFSAHWCPPCRCFTPQLIDTYSHLQRNNAAFEVIFVSSDRSRDSFESYLQDMPWLAIPYHLQSCRQELAALFGVQGIPTLVITESNGRVITVDGRIEANDDPKGLKFPWRPKRVNVLSDRLASRLQDYPAVVLFIEGEDSEKEFAENLLNSAAISLDDYLLAEDVTLNFFIASDSSTTDNLRDLIGVDDTVPLLTIINLPEGRWSILEEKAELNQAAVCEMVLRFLKNQLSTIRIGRR